MFTGLVADVGVAVRAERRADALAIRIRPRQLALADVTVGESIAHDGVCLTVTDVDGDSYGVIAGAETLARTTLGALRVGDAVNLERALRAGDRLGGHMVAGHVDATGVIKRRVDAGANLVVAIQPPPEVLRYIVVKGSIAVDGISLTVNDVTGDEFSVAIIPHTRDHTTLGARPVGGRVNLEVDIVAKYVEKLTQGHRGCAP